jgi:hypothetical protein
MNDPIFFQAVALTADRRIDTSSLPAPDGDYMKEFERILQEQFGIKITNLSGHRNGCSKALPAPWRPVTEFRETLRGKLNKYEVATGHAFDLYRRSPNEKQYMQDEYDWCLYIEPAPSHKEKFPADEIQGEVTPGENFRDTQWFPLKGTGLPSALLDYDLFSYDPQDKKYWHIVVDVNTALDITTHLQTDWLD